MKTLIIFILIFSSFSGFAQCNDSLVQKAISESGSDAIFLKEFKVRFDKSKASQPVRVAKYSAYLKSGNQYRFNVCNAREYEGRVVLQLFKNGKLKGSTIDLNTQEYKNSFDFYCRSSDTYMVLLSFIEGKSGCAVGVLSLVPKDTTEMIQEELPIVGPNEKLYLGIKNKLFIESTNDSTSYLTILSNKGKIEKNNDLYYFIADSLGSVTIKVIVKDKHGENLEMISVEFNVVELPIPFVTVDNVPGGLISKDRLMTADKLTLNFAGNPPPEKYYIKSFVLSDDFIGSSGKISNSEYFTASQKAFLSKLNTGKNFFIKKIEILMPDGKIVELNPVGFIIM